MQRYFVPTGMDILQAFKFIIIIIIMKVAGHNVRIGIRLLMQKKFCEILRRNNSNRIQC